MVRLSLPPPRTPLAITFRRHHVVFQRHGGYGAGPLATGTWTQTFDKDGLVGSPHQVDGAIALGGSSVQNDFSYAQSGTLSIGDTVYKDWNNNGTQDTGEGGLSAVVVSLYRDNNNNGVYDAGDGFITTTTSITGFYQFTGLPGGSSYGVAVSRDGTNLPTNYVQTQDPHQPGGVCTVCDDQGSVTLNATNVITMDFGYRPLGYGSIGDYVWKDMNGNGLQDPSEIGIPGVQVSLYADTNGNGVYDSGDALIIDQHHHERLLSFQRSASRSVCGRR
jgi:hypothetical protein